jgi:hypothetical protein
MTSIPADWQRPGIPSNAENCFRRTNFGAATDRQPFSSVWTQMPFDMKATLDQYLKSAHVVENTEDKVRFTGSRKDKEPTHCNVNSIPAIVPPRIAQHRPQTRSLLFLRDSFARWARRISCGGVDLDEESPIASRVTAAHVSVENRQCDISMAARRRTASLAFRVPTRGRQRQRDECGNLRRHWPNAVPTNCPLPIMYAGEMVAV